MRPFHFCIGCYQRHPTDESTLSPCCGKSLVTLDCALCRCPADGSGRCPQCGHEQTAPACPDCQQPITAVPDDTDQGVWMGSTVWNKTWSDRRPPAPGEPNPPRCRACGRAFHATIASSAGHPKLEPPTDAQPGGFIGRATITVGTGVSSDWTMPDHLDCRPYVEVRVERSTERGDLPAQQSLRLTPEEWLAVLGQLTGPLSTLLRQKPWWEDHT